MWDIIQKGGPMMYLIILSSVLAFGEGLQAHAQSALFRKNATS